MRRVLTTCAVASRAWKNWNSFWILNRKHRCRTSSKGRRLYSLEDWRLVPPAEHLPFFDGFDNRRRHVVFPGGIAGLQLGKRDRRKQAKIFGIVIFDPNNVAVFQEASVKMPQVGGDFQIFRVDDFITRGLAQPVDAVADRDVRGGKRAARGFARRINIELGVVLEKPAQGLEQAAGQVGIKFFVKDAAQARNTERDAFHLLRVAREVFDKAVVTR